MKKILNKKSDCYMIDLQGSDIVGVEKKNDLYDYNITKEDWTQSTKDFVSKKTWVGLLPFSLESIKLEEVLNAHGLNDLIFYDGKKLKTSAIVNVKFESTLKKWHEDENGKKYTKGIAMNKKKIRSVLYKEGFTLDGRHYVRYKRSGSKSRTGSCQFIIKEIRDELLLWSRMGIVFEENEVVDIASLFAYESLPSSNIIGTMKIKAKNILMIDDQKSLFKGVANVVEKVDGELLVRRDDNFEFESDIWDGESLLDERYFPDGKGMKLLRHIFFKSCSFNANVVDYFQEMKEKYGLTHVYDMFGNKVNVDSIHMITTPNSLKVFKFAYKFMDESLKVDMSGLSKEDKKTMEGIIDMNCKERAYMNWKKCVNGMEFGVCKSEKVSKFGDYNQLSYQMLNSLPLSLDEVRELSKEDIEYANLLKTDIEVFKRHITLEPNLNEFNDVFTNLVNINDDFQYTKMFRNYRSEAVSNHLKKLRKGKVKVAGMDYCTVVSNPIELLYTVAKRNTMTEGQYFPTYSDSLNIEVEESLNPYEVYTPLHEEGDEVSIFRNPHVCANNVIVRDNVKYASLDRWMNLTRNIVVINSKDNTIQERLNSMDMDSDVVAIKKNPIILKASKECSEEAYPTPVPNLPSQKKPRRLELGDIISVDHEISDNKIGEIINWSQILNSYYWDLKNDGASEELLSRINGDICLLSVLSCVEIDKAKKLVDINMLATLKDIREKDYLKRVFRDKKIQTKTNKYTGEVTEKLIYKEGKKILKPKFFRQVSTDRNFAIPMKENKESQFNTPMEHLQTIIGKDVKQMPRTKKTSVSLFELMKSESLQEVSKSKANRKQLDTFFETLESHQKFASGLMADVKDKQGRLDSIVLIKDSFVELKEKITKMKMTPITCYVLLYRVFDKDTHVDIKRLVLGVLMATKKELLFSVILAEGQANKGVTRVLEETMNEECDVEFYGKKYIKKELY